MLLYDPDSLIAARVCFEDEGLLAIDKAAGESIIDPHGRADLRSAAAKYLKAQGQRLEGAFPQLDRSSSGLVVFSKDKSLNAALARTIEGSDMKRVYRILTCDERIAATRGLEARREGSQGELALFEIRVTGQPPSFLRKHLQKCGVRVAGDLRNGGPAAYRLMVHLERLEFEHPATGKKLHLRSDRTLQVEPDVSTGIEEALLRRRGIASQVGGAGVVRLLHGHSDGVVGVEVDRYGDAVVVNLHEGRAKVKLPQVIEVLAAAGAHRIYAKHRQSHASVVSSEKVGDLAPSLPVHGEPSPVDNQVCLPLAGQAWSWPVQLGGHWSTGVFFDQRDNWNRIADASAGRRVLNLFAYTGVFTVAAILGGAKASTTVDASARALKQASDGIRRAVEHTHGDASAHEVVTQDVFQYLERTKDRFHVVVVDPPTYSTTKHSRFRSGADWVGLMKLVFGVVADGATVLCCSNDRRMKTSRFQRLIEQAGQGRRITSTVLPPTEDFPKDPQGHPHLKSIELSCGSDAMPSVGSERRARHRQG